METYELAIIGGGPAGASAGIYAARKKMKTVLITDSFGGQSSVSPDIQNWIGTKTISGQELADSLEEHLREYANDIVDIKDDERVSKITGNAEEGFEILTNKENIYKTKSVLVATGSHRRRLQAKNADKLEHKGITYCATCDGPLFAGKDVVVIGGGNAGFETASQLLAYTNSVTLLHKNGKFKADEITVKKVSEHPNFNLISSADTTEILGEDFVTGLKYKNIETGEEHKIKTDGIFVEIGAEPTTGFVKNLVDVDKRNYIKVNHQTQQTSTKGIWAAGDCTDGLYHQNNIAAGDAIKALEDIHIYLRTK